jgi:hypothetical protein
MKTSLFRYMICIIAGYMLLGCGADLTLELPNDHRVVVMNSNDVAICSSDGGAVTKLSVGKLADTGDYVYGTIVDPDSQSFREYFMLDTRTSDVRYFQTKPEWAAALGEIGITNLELRDPSAFYNMTREIWWRVVLLAALVIAVAVPVPIWWWRRSIRQDYELRRIRSQPGL